MIEQPHTLESQTREISSLEPEDKLDKLASVLRSYQQTNQDQLQQAQLQQVRMNKMLASLDNRLRSLETIASEQRAGDTIEQATDEELSNSYGSVEDLKFSGADVGKWMDETLRVGNWERDITKQVTYQAEKSLEKVPGVNLEDMQCSDRFCRATFTHEDGKQEAILDLLGEPPFVNEIFTLHEPDGRVMLYAARPGESLEELRSEAQEVAFEYSD